jgi:hypothetical protein
MSDIGIQHSRYARTAGLRKTPSMRSGNRQRSPGVHLRVFESPVFGHEPASARIPLKTSNDG